VKKYYFFLIAIFISLFALMAVLFNNARKSDVYFNEHIDNEILVTE